VPRKQRDHEYRDGPLESALRALARALDSTGVPWTVIGGVAVIARGVRRMTTDVDAVIAAGEIDYGAVVRALAAHAISPRTADAEEFARTNLVLLLQHGSGVEIDVSFGWTEFERDAIEMSTVAAFGSVRTRMARADELVVFKAIAGRPKDLEDASSLLLMHPSIDVDAVRRRVAELAMLAEAPELVAGLDAIVAASRAARPEATTAAAKIGVGAPRPPAKRRR